MKRYKFEIIIEEGSDEYWENLEGTGCHELTEVISEALCSVGFAVDPEWGVHLKLVEFTDK